MRMIGAAATAVFTAMMAAAPVQAADLVVWDEVAGWDVYVDPNLGNGCLIQAEYDDDSVVRIGFDLEDDVGYLMMFHPGWTGLQNGTDYPVLFDLDRERYEGSAEGIVHDGSPGLDITFQNADFLFDIAKKRTMTIYDKGSGEEVMSIDLGGTFRALQEAIACQDAQN